MMSWGGTQVLGHLHMMGMELIMSLCIYIHMCVCVVLYNSYEVEFVMGMDLPALCMRNHEDMELLLRMERKKEHPYDENG